MPLVSQSSENLDSEPSVTRWSFQDFEQAYEMNFSSKWFKGSSHSENEPVTNGNAQHQQLDGPQAAQNGSSTADGNGVVSRNKIPSTAVYEQYLHKKNGETPGSDSAATFKRSELWPPKPLPDFGSPEMNELAQSITRDIVRDTSDVKWDNIKGLENAKRIMKEAVVMPIKYPQYFKGLLSPWKGILLFGPPGTGKTMLAKAVASECNTTFFNISASSIVSKWRGAAVLRVISDLCFRCRWLLWSWGSLGRLLPGGTILKMCSPYTFPLGPLARPWLYTFADFSNQEAEDLPSIDEFLSQNQRHIVMSCLSGRLRPTQIASLTNIQTKAIYLKKVRDSEKLVKVLFELARHFAPSTIFLDEIDAIISQRGDGRSEHEASRRLKTELLVQMDGLMKSNDLVFLLAATNIPWELDGAMLRRLEKRILVPLPELEARRAMCEELLPKAENPDLPYDEMVELTEGYSGSDIRIVCKEAAMRPLRRLMAELEELERSDEPPAEEDLPKIGPITEEDVRTALKTTRPSAHLWESRYGQFDADFGSRAV